MREPGGQSRYFLPLGDLLLGVAWIVGSDDVLGGATDVAERRAMAAQLDAAERRATLLKEHCAIAGRFVHDIVLSADGNVLQINPAHERVFGYSPQHVVGRNVRDFVRNGEFVEKVYDWIAKLRLDPEAKLTEAPACRPRSGEQTYCVRLGQYERP